MYSARLEKLRHQLSQHNHQGIIISKRENIRYLTGLIQIHPVNREALLFVSPLKSLLYHSVFLSPPPGIPTLPMNSAHPLEKVLQDFFTSSGYITFEAHDLTYAEYQKISSALPHSTLFPATDLIETQRLIKDSAEIKAIQKACDITRRTMSWANQSIKRLSTQAINEISLSRLIEQKLYEFGADGLAFPIIVAFDQNSALPHHLPDKTKLKPNSIILLDFGCMVDGHASDMTRTICLGPPPPAFTQIETIVQSAYAAGLNLLQSRFLVTVLTHSESFLPRSEPAISRKLSGGENLEANAPGVKAITASKLDLTVRSVIDKAGFGKDFIHTSGHGLGLEIHEQPSLNSANTTPLSPGMVITLEPGIYLSGKFGCRHEHTLLLS